MIDKTGEGIKCPNFLNFTFKAQRAIEKFRDRFPKSFIRENKEHWEKLIELGECDELEFHDNELDEDCYKNIVLEGWENSTLEVCFGYLIACEVSIIEAHHGSYYCLKHNFWMNRDNICSECSEPFSREHCPECNSCPSYHEVRNHSLQWHDGKIHCIKCNAYIRDFDAG